MSFRKLLLAGAALAVGSVAVAAPASASIIDRPHFKVLGVVIVWAANDADGSTPIATDFVIGDASDTDLIAAEPLTLLLLQAPGLLRLTLTALKLVTPMVTSISTIHSPLLT